MTQQPGTHPHLSGLEIALEWSKLPADQLEVALKALEPQLARDHEYRMGQERQAHELALEQVRLAAEADQARRAHALYLTGLIAGFTVTIGMLTGAVIVGINNQPWLAAMLSGPSVLALATLFVLRRNDSTQTRAAAQGHRAALSNTIPPSVPTPADSGAGPATASP
ncbi:hypothetical protein GCM10010214_12360 [Streptomyces abikoensis]|nr:hypothetical protein GCM10010214_12360 [Streptomyces abikoensis]